MKTRLGFVSNSSSTSFIINKKDLTKMQIRNIKESSLDWTMVETAHFIGGVSKDDDADDEETFKKYLKKIKVAEDKIYWIDSGTHNEDDLEMVMEEREEELPADKPIVTGSPTLIIKYLEKYFSDKYYNTKYEVFVRRIGND